MAIVNPNDLFNNVPNETIHLNKFSLSYDNVHTTEGGRLTVASCFRVLPGESIEMSATPFVRTLPLVSPIFGKLDYFLHAFYVTNNTVSAKWKDYIRNGQSGEEQLKPDMLFFNRINIPSNIDAPFNAEVSTAFDGVTFDNILNGQHRPFFAHGSLADYLGLGSTNTVIFEETDNANYIAIEKIPTSFKHSLIPFKCYQAIWAEYFADANVMTFDDMDTIDPEWLQYIDEVTVNIDYDNGISSEVSHYVSNGTYNSDFVEQVEINNLFRTRYRCYAKDYFTSCLPEPQRGPDVLIPIGADIDIVNDFKNDSTHSIVMTGADYQTNELDFLRLGVQGQSFDPADKKVLVASEQGSNSFQARLFNAEQLRAEISSLTATITDLRTAVALQEFYESKARYGNRYKEFIYGSFGSMIPDNQLYRPWYLGGMRLPIQVSEVLQTANNQDSAFGVGTQFGRAVTGGSGFLFKRQFADYGTIMVIESIRPRNYYVNNIDRTWTVDDSLDEYWRKLQGVGEQAVYNYELFGYFSDLPFNQLQDTFGYQMRYSEYKQKQDEIHGDFKGSLSYWTIYRDFTNGAALNADFLQVMPEDINHIFQYSGNDIDHFLVNISFNIIREAPMDIYSIPRIS